MPRKKGIAESRKGKRKPPPKPQEKAKASTMPDDTASEHESTASGGNSPVDELDGMAADYPIRPIRHAFCMCLCSFTRWYSMLELYAVPAYIGRVQSVAYPVMHLKIFWK